jgi:hypothetical protein
LKQHADNNSWCPAHSDQYQTLDKVITEAMLHAESKLGPQKSNNFEWSPTLKRAIQAQRYWALCLKQAKELAVSSECLKQHREAAELMEHDPLLLLDTIKRLQKASATLKAFQKQHRSFRRIDCPRPKPQPLPRLNGSNQSEPDPNSNTETNQKGKYAWILKKNKTCTFPFQH